MRRSVIMFFVGLWAHICPLAGSLIFTSNFLLIFRMSDAHHVQFSRIDYTSPPDLLPIPSVHAGHNSVGSRIPTLNRLSSQVSGPNINARLPRSSRYDGQASPLSRLADILEHPRVSSGVIPTPMPPSVFREGMGSVPHQPEYHPITSGISSDTSSSEEDDIIGRIEHGEYESGRPGRYRNRYHSPPPPHRQQSFIRYSNPSAITASPLSPHFPNRYASYDNLFPSENHAPFQQPHVHPPPARRHSTTDLRPNYNTVPILQRPDADASLGLLHQSRGPTVMLNALIDPEDRIFVWDLRLPPATLGVRDCGLILTSESVKQSAFMPPQHSPVILESDYLPAAQSITLRPLDPETGVRQGITIVDVIQCIYNYFETPLSLEWYNSLTQNNPEGEGRIQTAFQVRCQWLDKSGLGLVKGKGPKRVDILGRSTVFRGFSRSNADPARAWHLELM